jgi:hypothetical protein
LHRFDDVSNCFHVLEVLFLIWNESLDVEDCGQAPSFLSDLQAFDNQMEKDGYWLVGSGCGSSGAE